MSGGKVDASTYRFGTRAACCARTHTRCGACACTESYHAGRGKQAQEHQYTIRGIPSEVDRALRRKAAQRKQSLNRLIVDELTAATIGVRKQADFHDLVGRWEPDPDFDEIIAGQRQIDADKWK